MAKEVKEVEVDMFIPARGRFSIRYGGTEMGPFNSKDAAVKYVEAMYSVKIIAIRWKSK